ncbi:MAG: hypothetical protein AB8I69_10800 [Anaerolineae bacterium]|jgi:hypothetical protein
MKTLWIVIALLSLAPLAATILDVVRGQMRGSPHNIAAGYLLYAFRIFFLLIVQFTIIPILFLVGPVWMFAIFLTVADLIAHWGSSAEGAGIPLLCDWFDIAPGYCWLVLLIYHAVSGALAYAIMRYGKRAFEILAGWYQRGTEWLAGQIQP